MHTYVHTCTHTYMHILHTRIRTYIHTYIHTFIHTHIHNTYIHTYIHTYNNTDRYKGSRNCQIIPHHKRQTKPSTGTRSTAEGLDPPGRLRINDQGEKMNIGLTYSLTEVKTNMESVRGLLYTYKTN